MIPRTDTPLPDLVGLFKKWWKFLLAIVMMITLIVILFLLVRPKEYLGVTTALPASAYTADRASIFNENIQFLYSSMGLPDELDRVIGTARLDTLYGLLVDEFHLVNAYGFASKRNARYRAIEKIKDDTRVIKSDYGELKVKVWHTQPVMAATLSRALMKHLQNLHQQVQLTNNRLVLHNLEASYGLLVREMDSLEKYPGNGGELMRAVKMKARLEQAGQYEKLLQQYRLVINTNPQVLVVTENAAVPVRHDRPDYFITTGIAVLASIVFALFFILVFESRKSTLL
jgi:hypothetical protein